ncbi:MAG: hypothetical protein ACPGAA_07110, partial [Flavobacteriaceae bacterium]
KTEKKAKSVKFFYTIQGLSTANVTKNGKPKKRRYCLWSQSFNNFPSYLLISLSKALAFFTLDVLN